MIRTYQYVVIAKNRNGEEITRLGSVKAVDRLRARPIIEEECRNKVREHDINCTDIRINFELMLEE